MINISKLTIALIACALGIGISLIYLPAMDYTPFSVRGGSSSGAQIIVMQRWSFHPIEMITFLIPSPLGLEDRHRYMPFTDYPNYRDNYFLSAVVGIINKKGIVKWYLVAASLLALFISVGRHFSLVYDIFFNLFPTSTNLECLI